MSSSGSFEVEVTQTQRFFPLSGWGKRRLPTDRYEWADRSGKFFQSKDLVESILPRECEFVGDWYIFKSESETDADGWQYALDFPKTFSPKKGPLDFVRRRFWRRHCRIREAYADVGVAPCPAFDVCLFHDSKTDAGWDLGNCTGCGTAFSIVNDHQTCSMCRKSFCRACCIRPRLTTDGAVVEGTRVCKPCDRQERDRKMREVAKNADLTCELESQLRCTIAEDSDAMYRRLVVCEADERSAAMERTKQRGHDKNMVERNRVLEKFRGTKDPRQGLVRLTILNAMSVPNTASVFSTNSAQRRVRAVVRFPGSSEAHVTPYVPFSTNPTFNVTSQALIGNDTEPLIIMIEDYTPKLLELGNTPVKGVPVMAAKLCLHDKHEGVVPEVTESLIYEEQGCAALLAYDPATGKPLPDGATIFAKWVFEVREVDAIAFCDTCGRSKTRCSCKH